jgi:hypothetical protein
VAVFLVVAVVLAPFLFENGRHDLPAVGFHLEIKPSAC